MSFNKALQQRVSGFEADVTIRYLLIHLPDLYMQRKKKNNVNHSVKSPGLDLSTLLRWSVIYTLRILDWLTPRAAPWLLIVPPAIEAILSGVIWRSQEARY